VTAQRLESGRWVTVGVYGDETEARFEPFDVVPIDVSSRRAGGQRWATLSSSWRSSDRS
jgi:hypothetical protein